MTHYLVNLSRENATVGLLLTPKGILEPWSITSVYPDGRLVIREVAQWPDVECIYPVDYNEWEVLPQ